MTKIARFGIVAGRKVPIEGLPGVPTEIELGKTVETLLSRLGFGVIAQRIIKAEPMQQSEVLTLLTKAGLPVLLKLVELIARRPCEPTQPMPLVVLPLSDWWRIGDQALVLERSRELLERINHPAIRVVIDRLDAELLAKGGLAVVEKIASFRPGLELVGPSIDEVVTWISKGRKRFAKSAVLALLREFRGAGLTGLQPTRDVNLIELLLASGFVGAIQTNLDQIASPQDLSQMLVKVREVAGQSDRIGLWVPGLAAIRPSQRCFEAKTDLVLLRALAVGSLCLPMVARRRVSSRFFSLEAIRLAHHFGATDYGLGAVDDQSARRLGVERWERLHEVVPGGRVLQKSPEVGTCV